MKRTLGAAALIVATAFAPLAAADDAKATCEKALTTMTKLAGAEGEAALPEAARARFVEECTKMPVELRTCFAEMTDEASLERCMKLAMETQMAQAMKDSGAPADPAGPGTAEPAKPRAPRGPSVCDPALATMKRINKELGEKDPTDEQVGSFLSLCESWPPSSRDCLAAAKDKAGVEECLAKVLEAVGKGEIDAPAGATPAE